MDNDSIPWQVARQLQGFAKNVPWSAPVDSSAGASPTNGGLGVSDPDNRTISPFQLGHLPSSAEESGDALDVPWWYTVLLVFGFFGLFFLCLAVREICERCFGITIFQSFYHRAPYNNNTQAHQRRRRDRQSSLANTSPGTNEGGLTSEEVKERKLEKQREERRLWYQYYLKPYIIELTPQNFALTNDKAPPAQEPVSNTSTFDLTQFAMTLDINNMDEENQLGLDLDDAVEDTTTTNNNNNNTGTMPIIEEHDQEETAASPAEDISRDFEVFQDQLATEAEATAAEEEQSGHQYITVEEADNDDDDLEAQTPMSTIPEENASVEDHVLYNTELAPEVLTCCMKVSESFDNSINNNNDNSIRSTCSTPNRPRGHHRRVSSIPCPLMEIWDPHENAYRRMEANCSICLNDYEVGDSIVRSAAGNDEEYCKHLYHYDCMLLWLSQGKKRCPMCRHWFVPALRIKDQMKLAHVTQSRSHHHLFDAEMNGVASVVDTDSTASHSLHENDNAGHHRDNSNNSSDVEVPPQQIGQAEARHTGHFQPGTYHTNHNQQHQNSQSHRHFHYDAFGFRVYED